MSEKQCIYPQNAPKPGGPYSPGIKIDKLFFISGQVPVNPDSAKLVEGDIKEQTRQVMENMKSIIKAAGGSVDDIVKVNAFLKDMSDFKAFNEVYKSYFNEPYPARSCVECANPVGALVEVEFTAVLND